LVGVHKRIDVCRKSFPPQLYSLTACVAYIHNISDLETRLLEFIEYHKLIGFEHFVFYDRSGQYRDFLGNVYPQHTYTHITWPGIAQDRSVIYQKFAGFYDQFVTINHCLQTTRKTSKWVGMFDLDEWLILNENYTNIHDILRNELLLNPNIGGLVVNRLESANAKAYNASLMVLEQFPNMRIMGDPSYKFFVLPERATAVSIHYPALKNGYTQKRFPVEEILTKNMRFNHFIDLYVRRSDAVNQIFLEDWFWAINQVKTNIDNVKKMQHEYPVNYLT